jgi:uncharacterized protein YjbI with pentapeptide repeats
MIEIKHRYTENVLYACKAETLREAVIEAVAIHADLYGADLRGANLYGADLYGADLRGANLYGANLDGEKLVITPIQIGGLYWSVLISEGYMRIGCERHEHKEWAAFDENRIARMDSHASEFWAQWGKTLLQMCKTHRKESLAFRKANPLPVEEKEAA